jgi:deoxycytidylate deaminase
MASLTLLDLDGGVERPTLFFGVVAAVGTPWREAFEPYLKGGLVGRKYKDVQTIGVSALLKPLKLKNPFPPAGVGEYKRVTMLMNRGDELRRVSRRGEALALMVAAELSARRARSSEGNLTERAFIINQLKHPDEVLWLRHIYGAAFHLIGLYSPRGERRGYLTRKKDKQRPMSGRDADALIDRDEDEETSWGQQVRNTFHMADVFIDTSSSDAVYKQVERFLDLLLGRKLLSPGKDEYGMYLAQAAAFRSTDLSRQVGAAILDKRGDVLGLGSNEVPTAGGGQYWGEEGKPDFRDHKKKRDYNEFMKRKIMQEIIAKLEGAPGFPRLTAKQREQYVERMESTPVEDLTEFGRCVHAEMEALLSAARRGVSVKGANLFTTTFPCHNCAKHIVDVGIKNVIYIEPYPKSKAKEMYGDSIWFTDYWMRPEQDKQVAESSEGLPGDKVWFRPFLGIAPRRYAALFSRLSEHGRRNKWKVPGGALSDKPIGLRLWGPNLSNTERESLAAKAAEQLEAALKSKARVLRTKLTRKR